MMRALLLLAMLTLLTLAPVQAQTSALSTDSFAWDVAEGLVAAQRYTYTLEIDGVVRQGPVPVTCGGLELAVCRTPIPPLTTGTHSLRVRITDTVDGVALTSAFSPPFAFQLRAVPAAPANVRIISTPTTMGTP